MFALSLLAVAGLLLAACAPAAGSRSSVAVPAGASAIPVAAGATLFVRVDYALEEFGISTDDMRAAIWVPSGFASEIGDATSYFSLHDVQGASGWQIDLSRMLVERTTVTNQAFGTTTTTTDLWAEIRVQVPADAIAGVYRVRGTIEARGGGTRPVQFRLDVAN